MVFIYMRVRIMKNNFKENLNKKIVNDICNETKLRFQQQLCEDARVDIGNIYDSLLNMTQGEMQNVGMKSSRYAMNKKYNFDYGLALNLFMQKFILENKTEIDKMRMQFIEKQRLELEISDTNNPNYFLGKNNCYYSFNYDRFIKQEQIIDVDESGNYTTRELINGTTYHLITQKSIEDSTMCLHVIDKHGKKIDNLAEAVRLLGFKKEVVKKVKRMGYCGKSVDIWADFMNMFYSPTQTGYYSDNYYNFYKWDYQNNQFVRQIREGTTPGAPNIADYEHKDSRTIVRTDYNGVGLSLQLA